MVRITPLAAVCAAVLASAAPAVADWSEPALETVAIGIDRAVSGETLPLLQLGGIGPAYGGATLQAVMARIGPVGAPARLELLVDGQVAYQVDIHPNGLGAQTIYLMPDPADTVLGAQVQTVELRTVGVVLMERVEVMLELPGFPPPGQQPEPQPQTACAALDYTLDADVNFTRLSISDLFDLAPYGDCKVDSITIVANSLTGNGRATARVDGWQASDWSQISGYPGQYTFQLWSQPVLGAAAPEIALSFLGVFDVQTVRLNLVDA